MFMSDVEWIGVKGVFEGKILGSRFLRDKVGPIFYGKKHSRTIDRLINEKLKDGGRAADFGAGPGFYTLKLVDVNPAVKVYSIDLSKTMLGFLHKKILKYNLQNRIEVRMEDVCCTTLESNSIDLAIAANLFHEVSEPQVLANEIYRVLKPGGSVIISEVFESAIGRIFLSHHKDNVHGAYKTNELETILQQQGFLDISSSKAIIRMLITANKPTI